MLLSSSPFRTLSLLNTFEKKKRRKLHQTIWTVLSEKQKGCFGEMSTYRFTRTHAIQTIRATNKTNGAMVTGRVFRERFFADKEKFAFRRNGRPSASRWLIRFFCSSQCTVELFRSNFPRFATFHRPSLPCDHCIFDSLPFGFHTVTLVCCNRLFFFQSLDSRWQSGASENAPHPFFQQLFF